ncbi:MarR family transcriptional regulator [Cytobacillus suaedae]|nr:MarR family transcriptional regulator [Cytobacillus suaedae]
MFRTRQDFLLLTRALYHSIDKNWEELGRKYGITPAQQHILFIVETIGEPMTVSQISEMGCWHVSSTSRILRQLEKSKLIEVTYDRTKSKNKYVTLTLAGKKVLGNLVKYVNQNEDFPLDISKIDSEELAIFLKVSFQLLKQNEKEQVVNWIHSARVTGGQYEQIPK